MNIMFLILMLFSFSCTFAQIENYISDNIYQNCDKKCYVLIKIPEIVYREVKDDSMVNAKIRDESRILLKESIRKDIAFINRSQLDTIKNCTPSVLLINVDSYTKKGGSIGLAAGAIVVNFIYFENVNDTTPDKKIEITGIGNALWGDLNVFVSAYQDAIAQFNDTISPKKFKFKPIEKKSDNVLH